MNASVGQSQYKFADLISKKKKRNQNPTQAHIPDISRYGTYLLVLPKEESDTFLPEEPTLYHVSESFTLHLNRTMMDLYI